MRNSPFLGLFTAYSEAESTLEKNQKTQFSQDCLTQFSSEFNEERQVLKLYVLHLLLEP